MAAPPYVRFFWSDWIADTAHLDLMQRGAYMALLEFVYQHARPLPGDPEKIYRICHATSPTEQNAIREILRYYFKPFEDPEHGLQYRHLRAERELQWSAENYSDKKIGAAMTNWLRWGDDKSKAILQAAGVAIPDRVSLSDSLATSSASRNQNQNQNHKDKTTAFGGCTVPASAEPAPDAEPKAESGKEKPTKPCPYEQIRDLWVEICPHLTRPMPVANWTGNRKATIRNRWAEELPELEDWANTFRIVAASNFLSGRVPSRNGTKPFQADLFWVAKAENLLKIYEGKYDNA